MNTTDVLPLVSDATLDFYEKKAQKLLEACRSIEEESVQHVLKYHPDPGKIAELNNPATNFSIADAKIILAREYGFEDFELLARHIVGLADENSAVYRFEKAADAIVSGDPAALTRIIAADPDIVKARSSRSHSATLLHYIAANGVEAFRQHTPENAPELADILLRSGSEPDAIASVYGQKWCTTLDLLVSSVHPAKAGLQVALVEKLADWGAAVDGIHNNCSPLLTAICFHYPDAARALVRRGARVDNIVTAAAMGSTELVGTFLQSNIKAAAGKCVIHIPWLGYAVKPPESLELAFVWAAMHNQIEVVSFFLDNGMNPAARDLRQWTALHWAAYYGYSETVQILLDRKAPLEARNEFGGTVLDQTLWATTHEGVMPAHLTIIRKLITAGAVIHPWWLFSNLNPTLDERVVALLQELSCR
ncbi:ankyrin repeat domain-containing protein [Dyadobacter sp. CY343]|uniref:ankyrin repeat domain-containing protein n=1 Tax=Dyadobacter sp. CY343 TaxID=2907299 RepID=UPI001F174F6D|nr:ankyrin repeat domain-containing protein [Dyadobacter sp. CY343]MCE7062026.1 ankyrin repeat domain-containing protein [Dyadobacter sp. CY343]